MVDFPFRAKNRPRAPHVTSARGGPAASSSDRFHGGTMPDILCSAAGSGFPLIRMIPVYLLMSAFHLAPWLGLLSSRPSGARST